MNRRKRVFIIIGFCLLLMVTGTVNILLNNYAVDNAQKVGGDAIVTGNFFTNFRNNRITTREQQMLYLDAILNSSAADTVAKQNAQNAKDEIIANMGLQEVIEYGVMSKGFTDAVVMIANNNISVLVKSAVLTKEEVAQIVDIVQTATGLNDIDNIKIQPIS